MLKALDILSEIYIHSDYEPKSKRGKAFEAFVFWICLVGLIALIYFSVTSDI